MRLTQKQIDLFWSKVDIRGEDECWLWTAGIVKGYGRVRINYRDFQAHHISFFLQHGHLPKPQGLHSCDNPACVNPKHIHEGTHQQNMGERAERDRTASGERNGRSKLTATKVREIRASNGTYTEISQIHGVARSLVWRIKHNLLWKEIE